jgi:hypothetical protein
LSSSLWICEFGDVFTRSGLALSKGAESTGLGPSVPGIASEKSHALTGGYGVFRPMRFMGPVGR